ncbi:MAG TPA: outer membrane beta-barrel protein [Chitinophagaceae bacterium]|nr:outer membrane beta-barrel protein [Chitinophagaceae bacterium]
MIKRIYLLSLIALMGLTYGTNAQELQIAGAGFTTNSTHNEELFNNVYEGYIFGVEYHYYFSDHWSIGTGVSYRNGAFSYWENQLKAAYPAKDVEGDPLEFRYHARHYSESEKWHNLRIPLVVQYETAGAIRWYFRTGLLLDLPLGSAKAKMQWNDLHTSGYYEQWDAALTGPKFAGFGNWEKTEEEQEITFKNSYSWTIETGIKGLFGRNYLYFGVFADVGLNSFRPKRSSQASQIEYTGTEETPLKFHNVWQQKRFKNKGLRNILFGLRVRYGIGLK